MKKQSGIIIYSPTDLIRYLASPFASWLDRYHLENLGAITPDEQTDEEKLLSRTGDEHEQSVLKGYKATDTGLIEIPKDDKKFGAAHAETLEAITRRRLFIRRRCATVSSRVMPISWSSTFQENIRFGIRSWHSRQSLITLFNSQLCCYSEMLAATTGQEMPERIGVILGNGDRVEFRVEDFIYYYRHIKNSFIAMQTAFSGNMVDCPEPLPRAEHGRWSSYAEKFFLDEDHLVQVANITVGQIKN